MTDEFKCNNCGYIHKPIKPEILSMITSIYCKGCGKDIKDQFDVVNNDRSNNYLDS